MQLRSLLASFGFVGTVVGCAAAHVPGEESELHVRKEFQGSFRA